MLLAAAGSWPAVLLGGAGGAVLVFAGQLVRDALARSRQGDIDIARMANHQAREEDRWADEEQRWALALANERRLLERLTALETETRIYHTRFEEQPWGPRKRD